MEEIFHDLRSTAQQKTNCILCCSFSLGHTWVYNTFKVTFLRGKETNNHSSLCLCKCTHTYTNTTLWSLAWKNVKHSYKWQLSSVLTTEHGPLAPYLIFSMNSQKVSASVSSGKQHVEALQIFHILRDLIRHCYEQTEAPQPVEISPNHPHLLSITLLLLRLLLLRLLLLLGLFLLKLLHLIHPKVLHGFRWNAQTGLSRSCWTNLQWKWLLTGDTSLYRLRASCSGYQRDYVSGRIMESAEAEPERIVNCLTQWSIYL